MKCSKCGSEINNGAKFCMNCGNKIEAASDIPQTGTIFGEGSEKTVYLPEEGLSNEPVNENLAFFGDEKTVLLDEDETVVSGNDIFGNDKTVLLKEEGLSNEPVNENLAFFGDEKTVLLDEDETVVSGNDIFGNDKTVLLKEEELSDEPVNENLAFFGDEKTVLLDEEEPTGNDIFGNDKTVLLKEEEVSNEPVNENIAFFGDEKTVLLDEEETVVSGNDIFGNDKTVLLSENDNERIGTDIFGEKKKEQPSVQPQSPVQDYIREQPPVQPQPPVQNYSQGYPQPNYGGQGYPNSMAAPIAPIAPAPVSKKDAPVKVGKGRIFGASIVAIFAIIFLLTVSLLVSLKLGLSGGTLKKRVEKINLKTAFNAQLDDKDVSENIYNSIGFGTVTHGNASVDDLEEYIMESDFLEFAGENVEKYADYIIDGKGKNPSLTAEDITNDFFAENNDAADEVFGYKLRKDDLKTIEMNLEKEGIDEALSVKEWKSELGIDPKNISYVVSYVMIGIIAALVLIFMIWIVIIVDKKGRHVMGFFGNIMFISGLVVFLAGVAATAGTMIAFSLTSNVVFYVASTLLLPFGILALIIGFSELVIGFIFKKIGKGIKNRKKLADAKKPVNQNPVNEMAYN